MQKLNFLNRCVKFFLRVLLILAQYCGIVLIVYDKESQQFRQSPLLRVYTKILFIMGWLPILFTIFLGELTCDAKLMFRYIQFCLCVATRLYIILTTNQLKRLFNKIHKLLVELRSLARHPNIFRLTHFVLILLALQCLSREWIMLLVYIMQNDNVPMKVFFIWFSLVYLTIFLFEMTINVCLLIVLIAGYDELHHCTRRVSNDVRTLRMTQRLEDGQLALCVAELQRVTAELMRVRTNMHNIAVGLIKYFRLQFVSVFFFCFSNAFFFFVNQTKNFSYFALIIANLAFYFTVFELLAWKSKLSRSFWNFHLLNYQPEFDRTIDELLLRELVEVVKVSLCGIPLNMRNFFKVLTICGLLVFVKFGKEMHKV